MGGYKNLVLGNLGLRCLLEMQIEKLSMKVGLSVWFRGEVHAGNTNLCIISLKMELSHETGWNCQQSECWYKGERGWGTKLQDTWIFKFREMRRNQRKLRVLVRKFGGKPGKCGDLEAKWGKLSDDRSRKMKLMLLKRTVSIVCVQGDGKERNWRPWVLQTILSRILLQSKEEKWGKI